MKLAICLHCGAEKLNAFPPCPACGFRPNQPEELAKSILLTDQYLALEELLRRSEQIQAGESLEFPKEQYQQVLAELESHPELVQPLQDPDQIEPTWSEFLLIRLLPASVLVLVLAVAGFEAWRLWKGN